MSDKEDKKDNKKNIKLMHEMLDEVLDEIKIGKEIKLRKIKYGNKTYYDLRRYYKDFPMKKGIRVNEDDFNEIKKIINNIK